MSKAESGQPGMKEGLPGWSPWIRGDSKANPLPFFTGRSGFPYSLFRTFELRMRTEPNFKLTAA